MKWSLFSAVLHSVEQLRILYCLNCGVARSTPHLPSAAQHTMKPNFSPISTLLQSTSDSNEGSYLVSVSDSSVKWMEVLTSVVVPGVRRGLKQSTDLVKKGFVSLLASIVLSLGRPTQVILTALPTPSVPLPLSSPEALTAPVWTQLAETFHSDLFFLLHEYPEQDFFENINHIQLHRRVRAFTKLRAILKAAAVASNSLAFVSSSGNDSSSSSSSSSSASMLMIANSSSNTQDADTAAAVETETGTGTASPEGQDLSVSASSISSLIGIASISHVLLPLALHPLVSEEFKRKDHLTLLQESSAFVGAVGEGSTDSSTHSYISSTLQHSNLYEFLSSSLHRLF